MLEELHKKIKFTKFLLMLKMIKKFIKYSLKKLANFEDAVCNLGRICIKMHEVKCILIHKKMSFKFLIKLLKKFRKVVIFGKLF